jgi:parvulin-like peptidyl-prolyl isomerase
MVQDKFDQIKYGTMLKQLQIGDRLIAAPEILSRLTHYQLLAQLVREIMIDQAIADLTLTPEEEAIAYQNFQQIYQINNNERLQLYLQQNYLDFDQLQVISNRIFKIEKFKKQTFSNQINSYFLKRKRQLDRFIYSLIRTQDVGIAQELYFRVLEGEQTFAEIATEYSQGSEAQTGGLIGPVELNTPHPQIAQLLMTAKPGQLFPPKQIDQWWVIVRLEKVLEAKLDEAMQQKLINELFFNWLQEELAQLSVTITESS